MAIGRLHVNGTTYTLVGTFTDTSGESWQRIEQEYDTLVRQGGNRASFRVVADGQERDLWIFSGSVASLSLWLVDEQSLRHLL